MSPNRKTNAEVQQGDAVPTRTDEMREMQEAMDASWGEVCSACFVRTPKEWAYIVLGLLIAAFFLYFFLVVIELLGEGAKVMTGCVSGGLFGGAGNPMAGVIIGMLATVCLQSSSITTSIIVPMVPSAISVYQGIYMVMGANIGTSVANTIVAMGQMGDGDDLERAFAGATVHDIFNFLTVAILLSVEVVTGYLDALTGAIVDGVEVKDGDSSSSFVKEMVTPITTKIIKSNQSLMKAVANGASCSEFYPVKCEDGLISRIKDTGDCPLFFEDGATQSSDTTSGVVVFIIAIILLSVCLAGLVSVLKKIALRNLIKNHLQGHQHEWLCCPIFLHHHMCIDTSCWYWCLAT
ncbi:Sodium-dependent phosphate transport protein 2A [Seminavis robusta]|uniref:Sodium-dependent phosphate transport protein 2A n=1 Tax=Seminavis robusta TaxID=568900 RepID=A0A9N8HMY9_9STRA|nr:Sodium-dependent phosphate transport protein 2A [Seminavis robusta]|eukprot:Sro943_g222800.1 Sodium-dependent phosphate transport protein 2A (350) ;mRNA; f:26064-27113